MATGIVEVVRYIVEQLVDNKEIIFVELNEGGEYDTVTIRVAPEDTGKVIGKQGRIATAIRTVAKAVGAKIGKRYNVEILDSEEKKAE